MDAAVLKHFCMVLAGNVIDYIFTVEICLQDWNVEGEKVS